MVQGDDRAQSTFVPTHRESRAGPEVVEVPSIESLTNDDDYDVDDDGDEQKGLEAFATSAAAACFWQQEKLSDNISKLNPPQRSDIETTGKVLMTSLIDQQPEIESLNSRRRKHSAKDVTPGQFNICSDLCVTQSFSYRQRTTSHLTTDFVASPAEVEITPTRSDGLDYIAISGRLIHSADVKADTSITRKLKKRPTRKRSTKKRRWSAENCSTRRLSLPGSVRQSKWISMAAIAKPQSGSVSGSSTLEQSFVDRSQVVGRIAAEKQRQATIKERRVARTMAVIMAAFVVCWLPFFAIYVLFPFCGSACSDAVGERFVTFIVWLGYVNSTINPVIYTVFNVDFRRAFKSLLFAGCCCRRRRVTR